MKKINKYKKILLVDCENVGFSLEIIPKNTCAYMFVSYSNKLYHFAPENMKIIDISQLKEQIVKKSNYMDFYIMYFLTKRIKEWKKCEIVIISKDKDFEGVRNILLQENMNIMCFKGTLSKYLCDKSQVVNENNSLEIPSKPKKSTNEEMKQIAHIYLPKWCFDKMTSATKNLVPQNKTMDSLKEKLSNNQKKIFVYSYTHVPIFQFCVSINYDIYKKQYIVKNLGHFYYSTYSLKDAINVYTEHIERLTAFSQKYKENKIFKKAKRHSMLSYIEISAVTGKNLYKCMCEFMDEDEAYEKYSKFLDDLLD